MESATSNDKPSDDNNEKTLKIEDEIPQEPKIDNLSSYSGSLQASSQVEEEKVQNPQDKAETVPDLQPDESNV